MSYIAGSRFDLHPWNSYSITSNTQSYQWASASELVRYARYRRQLSTRMRKFMIRQIFPRRLCVSSEMDG